MSAPTRSAVSLADAETFDCRAAFAEELSALARTDDRIMAVCNDSVGSSGMIGFRDEFPERLVNVGIAEQDMVGVAAGLANAGKIPFVCAAGPFLTGRALEQIKVDIAYSNVHVVLCGQSPGMAYGELGPTHHSIEDLAWTRAVANLDIIVPSDPEQTRAAVRWAVEAKRPVYLRVPRFKVPATTPEGSPFAPGTSLTLREGDDVTIIAIGTLVSRALAAADRLSADGISARVINMPFVEPLDKTAILAAARQTRGIVTAEEATTTGGLGAGVAEIVVTNHPVPMRILGIPRAFAPTGNTEYLLGHFGLTEDGVVAAVRDVLGRG